jgi:hypothetical protein
MHSHSVVSEMAGRINGNRRICEICIPFWLVPVHWDSYWSYIERYWFIQERFTAQRWVNGMKYTFQQGLWIVFYSFFDIHQNFVWQSTSGIRTCTCAWNKRRLIRPNVAVQLVAHLFSTIEVRVSYFGPELAILSEPVLIFLIIQVRTVVVSQNRPRPLPSTSSQVTLPFEVVCCELPKASIN